jgi:hypothetical protein
MHWCTALCSESMGNSGTFFSRAARVRDLAGGDHAFLIGEADRLAGEDRRVGRFKAGDANDGGDHKVHVRMGGTGYRYPRCPRELRRP